MPNLQQLERRIKSLERQVSGHHEYGTIASRLARLEDTVSGDPMAETSIADRLDEIEARYRGEPVPERVEHLLEAESTGETVEDRVTAIEARLDRLAEDVDDEERTEDDLQDLLDRIEARLLALEHARDEQ